MWRLFRLRESAEMSDGTSPWLVVGLGNPGPGYARNRHNAGFMVVDLLAQRIGAKWGRARRAASEVAEGFLSPGGPKLVLAKPTTFMNLLGGPTVALAQFYKIPADQIIGVHDELDLGYGTVRAKFSGGEGGHNGLRSMSKSLGTKDYARVRFGIGRPPGRQDPADYVLSDFNSTERKELDYLIDRAADMVESIILSGVEPTQNKYH
jgi:peptidyl-tRNA hydrolase, PTH1 family